MKRHETSPLLQTIEWRASGVRFALAELPPDLASMLEWSNFWSGLRPLLEEGEQSAINRYLCEHIVFGLSSKSLVVEEQEMFDAHFNICASPFHLDGELEVQDISALHKGMLIASIRLRFELPLAGAAGLAALQRLCDMDPGYVWGLGLLHGPAGMPADTGDAQGDFQLVGLANGLR